MKKRKKIIIILLLMSMCIYTFFGCLKKTTISAGPIPDGIYEYNSVSKTYTYFEGEQYRDYWEIEGDEAVFYFDNWLDYRAKIVQKNGEIYFEGYKWITIIDILGAWLSGEKPTKLGTTDIYRVKYNLEEKSITVELYQKGE